MNKAEIAINFLKHQCLTRCIPDRATMVDETKAWEDYQNETVKPTEWQYRTEEALIKLKSLYHSIQKM